MPVRFRGTLLAVPLAVAASVACAQESAEWSRSPGINSATLAVDDQYELVGSAAGTSRGNLVVITHWKRRSDTGVDAALGGSHVLVRCLDVYDAEQSQTGATCFVPLK